MINTFENSKQGKHIDIKYNFIKDMNIQQKLSIKYVSSSENIADMFTKPLGSNKFKYFISLILVE